MPDVHEGVDFSAGSDNSIPQRTAINVGEGLYHHMVFDHGAADMRKVEEGSVFVRYKTKAGAADDAAWKDGHMLPNAHVGLVEDVALAVDHGPFIDLASSDIGEGADIRVFVNLRLGVKKSNVA